MTNIRPIIGIFITLLVSIAALSAATASAASEQLVGFWVSAETYPTYRQRHRSAIVHAIEYDDRMWIVAAETAKPTVTAATSYDLILGETVINRSNGQRSVQNEWQQASATDQDLQLIQLTGPIKASWRTAIEQSGYEIVQYIHPFTYVVWGEAAIDAKQSAETTKAQTPLATLQRQGIVHFSAPFVPSYRVLPAYRTPTTTQKYHVLAYQNADLDTIHAKLNATSESTVEAARLGEKWMAYGVTLSAESLLEIGPTARCVHRSARSGRWGTTQRIEQSN